MRIDRTDPAAPNLVADVTPHVDLAQTREKIANARAQAAEHRAQAAQAESWAALAQKELDDAATVIAEFEALQTSPAVDVEAVAVESDSSVAKE